MGLAVAAGYTQLSGITIPEIWSIKLLQKFYAACRFVQIVNRNWEGEIKDCGDKVKIRTRPAVTINRGTKGQKMTIQQLVPAVIDMEVDKMHWWYIGCDSVDKFQSDYDFMQTGTEDAANAEQVALDEWAFSAIYADADAANKGAAAGAKSADINLGSSGAPLAFTSSTALGIITDISTVFDEKNIPSEDRKIVLPPWACGAIMKSDLKNASITGDGKSILRSGKIGEVLNMGIFSSNNLYSVNDSGGKKSWHAVAAHPVAVAFASQFKKVTVFDKLEQQEGSAIRGVHVFGWKTVEDDGLIDLYIAKS